MKKILALMLALAVALPFASCDNKKSNETTDKNGEQNVVENNQKDEITIMTYDEFMAADIDSPVVVDTYVQAKQSWWNNKGTFYTQAEDGAYFLYEMACTEEEYNKLVPGTKIRVSGFKAEWSGEIEIVDAKYEILDGEYIAEAFDATSLLGTDELIKHQNKLVAFNGMTVKAIEYKNETPGDDIYVTLGLGDAEYDFCVEVYLTGVDSDVYTTVGSLNVGDTVDVEAFLYWYNGANPHITSIKIAEETADVMTYEEFAAAELDTVVTVDTFVQAKQSWWDNKGTFYTQSKDGAYFLYEMACTEEEYNKLVPGTKIRVSGYKAEWSGEIEIVDAKYEILEGEYIAEAFDATSLLGTDELIKHQNKLVFFKGMTVKAIEYKNGTPGDDIYVTLGLGDAEYDFCVEVYLTGVDSEVYKTAGSLNVGDTVDVEAFLYWYNGANPHIYSISPASK